MNKPKKLKAYEVHDGDESGVVVFATNSAAARREGAGELSIDWESVDRCQRAPHFDDYAPGPVPPMIMIGCGWWFGCLHCGAQVNEHSEEAMAEGENVYCGPRCLMQRWQEKRAIERTKANLLEVFDAKFPGLQVVNVYCNDEILGDASTYHYSSVQFRVPGCEQSVEWRFGEDSCLVVHSDKEAYLNWMDAHPEVRL